MLYLTIYKRREETSARFLLHHDHDVMNRNGYAMLVAEWAFDIEVFPLTGMTTVYNGDIGRIPASQVLATVAGVLAYLEANKVRPLIAEDVTHEQ